MSGKNLRELESFLPAAKEEIENLKLTIDSDIEEKLRPLAERYEELLGKLDGKIEPVRLEFDEKLRRFSENLDIFEARLENSGDVRESLRNSKVFFRRQRKRLKT